MKPWSHLPNAHHIDWVLESAKTHDEIWARAWVASYRSSYAYDASRDAVWAGALNEALNAAWEMAWEMAWEVARNELDAAWAAALNAALSAAYNAARGAIIALIAYDDCDEYLQMSYEQLLIYATLSEKPQAVLLLPLKWVQERKRTVA